MTSVVPTCRDCNRPRKPDELFCECGALYDYTVTTVEQRADGESNGKAVAATTVEDFEWQPAQYERTFEQTAKPPVSKRVVRCRNCDELNPETFVICWHCKEPLVPGDEAEPPWSLRRILRLEKPPLPAGERAKEARSPLRTGLIVAGVLLLATALLIGAIKAWGPASAGATHGYGVAREALFPRYNPEYPASVNPPRTRKVKKGKKRVKITHPPADAFDRNLSTYWQTKTGRLVPDKIRVTFKPAAHHIEEFLIYAGDPTATTIVPESLQMTFYRWDPDPAGQPGCEEPTTRGVFPVWVARGAHCIIAVAGPFELKNTPTPQRFSTGKQANVALVVITIRGVHSADNPKAHAAITEIEFFDRD